MLKKILVGMAAISIVVSSAIACSSANGLKTCNLKYQKQSKHCVVTQVTKAVSKTGLSASQTKKIADGILEYNKTKAKIKEMKIFPVDSFINDNFDEKRFIKEMSEKSIAQVAAKAALFKYVFSILDKDQRKVFKREYAAPMIEQMIKSY